MRELWPIGKEDRRGLYKRFLARYGELALRNLVSMVLDNENIPWAEHVRDDDIDHICGVLSINANCMFMMEDGVLTAKIEGVNTLRWFAVEHAFGDGVV